MGFVNIQKEENNNNTSITNNNSNFQEKSKNIQNGCENIQNDCENIDDIIANLKDTKISLVNLMHQVDNEIDELKFKKDNYETKITAYIYGGYIAYKASLPGINYNKSNKKRLCKFTLNKNNKIHGKFKIYKGETEESGLSCLLRYIDGELDGKSEYYYDNGYTAYAIYEKNKLNIYHCKYKSGNDQDYINYITGKSLTYYDNKENSVENFRYIDNGLIKWIDCYENNIIEGTGQYKLDNIYQLAKNCSELTSVGIWRYYDINGDLVNTKYYKNNVKVEQYVFDRDQYIENSNQVDLRCIDGLENLLFCSK